MNTRIAVLTMLAAVAVTAAPLGTEFTYQGVLSDGGTPASGVFDFRCFLYNSDAGGSQVGPVVLIEDLMVADGRFTTLLDFGAVFDGAGLWLEVGVRDGASTGAFTVLQPRQELTAAPFAQHAAAADTATTAVHATTAGSATTAGEADTLDGQHGAYYLTWSNFAGIPGDLADGDDDTLADLSCSGDDIARWTGSEWNCSADDDTPYARTYVVGPVGTTTQNGTALRNAIAAIAAPGSQEEAVLLKLEPGVYSLGSTGIEIAAWITVEGAGENATLITGAVCGGFDSSGSTVYCYSDVGLRQLSVENTCADPSLVSIAVNIEGSRVVIDRTRFEAAGAADYNVAVYNVGPDLRMRNVTLKAENADTQNVGFLNYESASNADLFDVNIEVDGGDFAFAIYNNSADGLSLRSSTLRAFGTPLSIGFCSAGGDDFFLEGVTAYSDTGWGVSSQSASGTLDDVRAEGVIGIDIRGPGGTVSMVDVHAEGSSSGVNINSSTVTADIRHSWISGGTYSVDALVSGTVALQGVILDGGPVRGAMVTCTACMRNGTFSASGCP